MHGMAPTPHGRLELFQGEFVIFHQKDLGQENSLFLTLRALVRGGEFLATGVLESSVVFLLWAGGSRPRL